jgi:type III secretory pathway component EscS
MDCRRPPMQVKKVITYVAVAFVVFYLFTRPAEAAAAVNGVFDGILQGANQLATFFSSVLTP